MPPLRNSHKILLPEPVLPKVKLCPEEPLESFSWIISGYEPPVADLQYLMGASPHLDLVNPLASPAKGVK